MPAVFSTLVSNILNPRNESATNASSNVSQVLCVWPVSSLYGIGPRVLYYVLMAACVFARKAEWARKTCLTVALLLPAIAAIHGIVLAAVHTKGAVDMDIYGVFQLCSIGVLAAPLTVRLSRTYFSSAGRNIIFVWTGLLIAGLLSLVVEFYRASPSHCPRDDSGNLISPGSARFPYGTTCGLTCSIEHGPYSPIRHGSGNGIYVIPAPQRLSVGTATILAAGCCLPAIVSLVATWNKILEINWKLRFKEDANEQVDEPIEGTNGATNLKLKRANLLSSTILSSVEILVFLAAVLAILIIGERNFFSTQVRYQTEPIENIGQWAPIAGTVLALLGALYLVIMAGAEIMEEEAIPSAPQMGPLQSPTVSRSVSITEATNAHVSLTNNVGEGTNEVVSTGTRPPAEEQRQVWINDDGNRRMVGRALNRLGNYFGSTTPDTFNDTEFRRGASFPRIPGEEHRNPSLLQIRARYSPSPTRHGYDETTNENNTPLSPEQLSVANNPTWRIESRRGPDASSATPATTSAPSQQLPPSSLSTPPVSAQLSSRRQVQDTPFELDELSQSSSVQVNVDGSR